MQLAAVHRSRAQSFYILSPRLPISRMLNVRRLSETSTSSARALHTVTLSPSIKSLGVILDSHLTFDDHVAAVSKACFFNIRAFPHIRAFLPDDVAKMMACSILRSRLDYLNSLLVGMSETNFSETSARPEHPRSRRNGDKAI